jgi:malonyl-CoA O-methyltransferase
MNSRMIDKSLVQKHFDLRASGYDQYANVQLYMAARLLQILDQQINASQDKSKPLHILEIGCGTGLLTQKICEKFPQAQLTVMDISSTMLDVLYDKLSVYTSRLNRLHADAEKHCFDSSQCFDMILSNATFQWFNDPTHSVARYIQHLRPQGWLAFATFAPLTFTEFHESMAFAQQHLHQPLQRVGLSYNSADDWKKIVQLDPDSAFTWLQELKIEHFPNVRAFLQAIQNMGATNAHQEALTDEPAFRFSKQMLLAFEKMYDAHFRDPTGIRVTYDIGYGIYQRRNEFITHD